MEQEWLEQEMPKEQTAERIRQLEEQIRELQWKVAVLEDRVDNQQQVLRNYRMRREDLEAGKEDKQGRMRQAAEYAPHIKLADSYGEQMAELLTGYSGFQYQEQLSRMEQRMEEELYKNSVKLELLHGQLVQYRSTAASLQERMGGW